MATEDSRDGFKYPRWGSTTGDVPTAYAAEPPGQKKDDGWEPGVDKPTGEWWNWLHQQTYYFLRYIEGTWLRRWTEPHLFRSEKGTSAADVSAGVGLSVDVVTAQVWMEGFQFTVPAATNLALAAADPTNDRFDLVVARVVAGMPTYAVITGTPAASPAEPSPLADDVPIARVRVNATATVPGSIAYRREYGVLELDKVRADSELIVGDDSGNPVLRANESQQVFMLEGGAGSWDVGNGQLTMVVGAGLSLAGLTGDFTIPAEQVALSAAVTRKYQVSAAGFMDQSPGGLVYSFAPATFNARVAGSAGDGAGVDLNIPADSVITEVQLFINRITLDETMALRIMKALKTTGVATELGVQTLTSGVGSTGDQTMTITGLSETVDDNYTYYLRISWSGLGTDVTYVHAADVTYTQTRPFDSV